MCLREFLFYLSTKTVIVTSQKHCQPTTSRDRYLCLTLCTPQRIPISLLAPTWQKLQVMEKNSNIVKEEDHTPWVSSLVLVDKRKQKDRGNPSTDNIRICICSRDMNKALKRPHFPMITVEVANQLSGAKMLTTP